jgi:hypothetical protein
MIGRPPGSRGRSEHIDDRLELVGGDRGSGNADVHVGLGSIDDLTVGAGVVEQ